jgi:hypothetical protein
MNSLAAIQVTSHQVTIGTLPGGLSYPLSTYDCPWKASPARQAATIQPLPRTVSV